MTKRTFKVSTEHIAPEFTFTDKIAVAHAAAGYPGMWFATADDLGCGKDFDTPEKAVRYLFDIQACMITKIEEVKGG